MNNQKPVIYQLLPRLFTNTTHNCVPNGTYARNGSGKLNDIDNDVIESIKELGVTHIWLTGVIEHAQKTDWSRHGIGRDNPHVVKGEAGSPYAIKDYYDIDPDLATDVEHRMEEFEALVARIHDQGMQVIIDFVPNHVARRYHSDAAPEGTPDLGADDDSTRAFDPQNNFYYIPRQLFAPSIDLGSGKEAYTEFPAKATGNDCFSAFPSVNDWYETVKLNYGVDYSNVSRHFSPTPDTWQKMLSILLYWAEKGVDGFRCDMAFMVPVEFWDWAVTIVKERYSHIKFIAEIYDTGLYREFISRGHFDYLYDKVNLYDTLRGIQTSHCSAAQLTGCWQTVDGIGSHMLNFLENHDEQRFASPYYASDPARAVPSMVVSTLFSTGPMMIYFGQELGEPGTDAEGFSGHDGRTTIFDYWSVATVRRWLNRGACNGSLTPQQKKLRGFYRTLLRMANEEKAIREGGFFDLMYVNLENPGLNPHRHYAFMRHADGEALVVIVNFGDDDSEVSVNIPRHAFGVLGFPEGVDPEASELLAGANGGKTFASSCPFVAEVPAHGAAIWKVCSDRIEPLRPAVAQTHKTVKKN